MVTLHYATDANVSCFLKTDHLTGFNKKITYLQCGVFFFGVFAGIEMFFDGFVSVVFG